MPLLTNGHWQIESFTQQVTKKEWRDHLLKKGDDRIIVKGVLRKLKATKVFADIYKISKIPLK